MAEFLACEMPKLPITGLDLKEAKVPPGRVMGIMSNLLKDRWKDSNFQLGKEDLLELVPTLVDAALEEEKRLRKVDKEKAKREKQARKRKSEET